jgi:hypothetical protein
MNRIMNDEGRLVEAIGAPSSLERVKAERPKLIDTLNRLYEASFGGYGRGIDEAIEIIRAKGVKSQLETRNILLASKYGER